MRKSKESRYLLFYKKQSDEKRGAESTRKTASESTTRFFFGVRKAQRKSLAKRKANEGNFARCDGRRGLRALDRAAF